jgi:hypothetical protein
MTIFMDPAYVESVYSFVPEYVPYLRDDKNQRLKKLDAPYDEIEAPDEVYDRFLKMDRRQNEPNDAFNLPPNLMIDNVAARPTSILSSAEIDVNAELELTDEYGIVTFKKRTRSDDKKKTIFKVAKRQCQIRDNKLEEEFQKQGKNFDNYRNSVAEYIIAKLLSHKLYSYGSILHNVTPSLRDRQVQSLNVVIYQFENYQKAVKKQRRQEKLETERREMQQKRRELIQRERLDQHKKRQKTNENEDNGDYFGAVPENYEILDEQIEPDYNLDVRMQNEVDQLMADDSFGDQTIIPAQDAHLLPRTQYVLGDSIETNTETNFSNFQSSLDLGTCSTSDPEFFDLDKLVNFFLKLHFNAINADQLLIQSIQTFVF